MGNKIRIGVDELSAYTGWSKGTIYHKIAKREIPHYKRGRVFFCQDEIDKWLRKGKVKIKE